MKSLKLDLSYVAPFIMDYEMKTKRPMGRNCLYALVKKMGKGHDFLGWIDLPTNVSENLITDIEEQARKIQSKAKIFVVLGIGGSYLGARAVIEALKHPFDQLLPDASPTKILYAGQNISEEYLSCLLDVLDQEDYALTVISKSGTTTETAIAFRILKNHLIKKYGKEEAKERIIAITDANKGALKKMATEEGYKTYTIPDNVGGRYSVLTPVGLLPIAVAGFNIRQLLQGAIDIRKTCLNHAIEAYNPAVDYAVVRNILYHERKTTEILVNYNPQLHYFTEWWKQLFGESEGKENKGIFTAGVDFSTDLHSMGQYIQEGERNLFETIISVGTSSRELQIPLSEDDGDGLNYLAGKNIHYINRMAETGTIIAHSDGNVPNIRIEIPEISEYYLGQLIYFFEISCGISGYMLDINPFDQPGVEAYKKNMFALLGKPGFEKESKALLKRIKK